MDMASLASRPDEHPVAADLFGQSRAAAETQGALVHQSTYIHQDIPPPPPMTATAPYLTRSATSGAARHVYDPERQHEDRRPGSEDEQPEYRDDYHLDVVDNVINDEDWVEPAEVSKEGAIPVGKELADPPVFPPGRVLEDITSPDAVEGEALSLEEKLAAVGSHMTPGLLKAHEAWLEKVAAKLDVTKIEQSLTSVKRVLPASNNAKWSRGDVVERCKALLNLRGEVIERVGSEEGGKAIADNTSYGFVFIRNDDYTTRYLSLPAFIAEFDKEDSKDVYV